MTKPAVSNFGLKGKAKSRAAERAEAAAIKAAEFDKRRRAPASSADRPPREPYPDAQVEQVLKNLEADYPMVIAAPMAGLAVNTLRYRAQQDPELGAVLMQVEGHRRARLWASVNEAGDLWRREAFKLERTVHELGPQRDVSSAVRQQWLQELDELQHVMPKESYGHLLDGLEELWAKRGGSAVATPQALGAGDGGSEQGAR